MRWQGVEIKEVRREGLKGSLLTVLKAVSLKIIQAPVIEFLSHCTAPQDGSTNRSQQVADEEKHQVQLHLLQAPVARGCGCRLKGECQAAPSKVIGTLAFPRRREALGQREGSGRERKEERRKERG